jgi:membrane fusion protein, multidrug efflux system
VISSWLEPSVYVINNGKAELRNIVVEQHEGNQASVSGNLKDGEVVVTSGFINLKNGSRVAIK